MRWLEAFEHWSDEYGWEAAYAVAAATILAVLVALLTGGV